MTVRQVSNLEIFLGTSLPPHFDTSHFGYQPPLSPEEFEALAAMKKKGISSGKQQQHDEEGDEEDGNEVYWNQVGSRCRNVFDFIQRNDNNSPPFYF